MTALAVGWVLLVLLFTALFLMPRWCFRSLHRHRMWRLRDDIVDKLIAGELPADHPAVRELVTRVQRSIDLAPRITLLRLLIIDRITGRTSPQLRAALDHRDSRQPGTAPLTPHQCELVDTYNHRIDILRVGTTLTGSWLGIAAVTAAIPVAFAHRGVRTLRHTLARAVDAVSTTRFGDRVNERARLEELHIAGRSRFA